MEFVTFLLTMNTCKAKVSYFLITATLLLANAEFGFVVTGKEFDLYPKHKIRHAKSWDWFIEEPRKESDDDEEEFDKKMRKGVKRNRRKGEENEDEEWTGESEDEEELVVNARKVNNRPRYSTRSKDHRDNPQKDKKGSKDSKFGDADEDEETLGGFIVGDDDADDLGETDEEEEEFVEDEYDELDD